MSHLLRREYGKRVPEVFKEITDEHLELGDEIKEMHINFKDHFYRVQLKRVDTDKAFNNTEILDIENQEYVIAMYMFDETRLRKIEKENFDQKLVVGLIYIDNYEEVLQSVEDVRASLLAALIDRKINKFVSNIDGIVRKLEKDKYFMVLKRQSLEAIRSEKFDIVDDVKTVSIGNELQDVSEVVKGCGFGVFTGALENGGTVRGINAKGQGHMPRKKIDALVEVAKTYGAKGLAYLAVNEDGTYKSSFAKFFEEEQLKELVKAMDGEPGDLLLFAADKKKVVWDVLGALRLHLAKSLDLLKKDDFRFLWVTEFPLLEWSEEQNRFVAMHHPFTMPMEEDLDKIDSDPGAVRAQAYDIVLNGNEIGGGSIRIHQDDIQSKMFEVLGFTPEQAQKQFGFLLDAFKYGVPPHAGLAYGLDRLIMLMAGEDSIREVMAFPKVKDASCLMMQAPDEVDPKQLEELGLVIEKKEEKEEK